jgi:hypothetical protein
MAQPVLWVIDTSSIIEIRRSVETTRGPEVFQKLGDLVTADRIIFVKQVVEELERAADPVNPDAQYQWAKTHEAKATERAPSFDDIKNVLALVPKVLDPDKDSGAEEADPYLLALASLLRTEGLDARIVTQETKDTPKKMSLNTACGLLGIPSVPLAAFLQFERILT